MTLTDPWSGEDDSDYDYYDTPSGQRPAPWPRARAASGGQPGRPGSRPVPRPRSGGRRATGRTAALPPSLIVHPWHPRPGRGSVRSDKETP
jgi:hypothetical protein